MFTLCYDLSVAAVAEMCERKLLFKKSDVINLTYNIVFLLINVGKIGTELTKKNR